MLAGTRRVWRGRGVKTYKTSISAIFIHPADLRKAEEKMWPL